MDSQHPPSPNSQTNSNHHPSQKHSGIGRRGWIILGTVTFASLLAIGIVPRLKQQSELQAAVKAQSAVPSVNVITAKRAPSDSTLVLPGSIVSLNQTTVYARATGYLRHWLVDIGDHVQKGQLLAEIDSPDVDQQVAQARAQLAQTQASLMQARANLAKGQSDLQQARANEVLAYKTWQRWRTLVKEGVVSQQDADTQEATYRANIATVQSARNTVNSDAANIAAAAANVNASQANYRNYTVLQSFKEVVAPFTGVITARNINDGALVTAGSNNNTSLYTITSYDTIEVNVNVPQANVPSIQVGQTAQVQVRDLPQKVFTGRITRTTNTLDPSSRTQIVQVVVHNPDNLLQPGMYATVKFNLNRPNPPFVLPDNAVVINAKGTQVATVAPNQTVHYQLVQLGRDDGTQVEVTSGLTGSEAIITNPLANFTEGTRVHPVATRQ